MNSRPFAIGASVLATLLAVGAGFVGERSLAEMMIPEDEEALSQPAAALAVPPVLGLDAILSRIPDATAATAGRGVRVVDVENSAIYRTDETSEFDRPIRQLILGHEVAVRAAVEAIVPGAAMPPASFSDGEEDVVRYVRETKADVAILAFGEPSRVEKREEKQEPPETSRLDWLQFGFPGWREETYTSRYLYAAALRELPDTVIVKSIGNHATAISENELAHYIAAIPNGVAAVWVDENQRIHPYSNRCGPDWKTRMCIAVYGTMHLSDGRGAPYHEDGARVHGTSVAAARLAAGLALLKQWLLEAEGRTAVSAEELLQIACNTARLGPNTHVEVGCGTLDLDTASRSHGWAATARLVTPTLERPVPAYLRDRDEPRVLEDGSLAIEGRAPTR